MPSPQLTRRQLLALSGTAMLGAAGLGWHTIMVEPQDLTIEQVEVRLKRLPDAFDGFRIAQLSDLHLGIYLEPRLTQRALALTNSLQPDLVVITGDFLTRSWFDRDLKSAHRQAEEAASLLQLLKAPFGSLSVFGNHDIWIPEALRAIFRAHHLRYLDNATSVVERGGAALWIVGLDDALWQRDDLEGALRSVPRDVCTILLVHEPDFADRAARFPIDLQLSGHSHGGQVRLPLIGAPLLPQMATKYPIGLNRVGELQVYTNRGIGMISPQVRLNCPPEITLVTLRKAGA